MGLFRQLQELTDPTAKEIVTFCQGKVCRTLPDLAQVLGVPHSTLKTSWRPMGMPGEPGRYKVSEIVAWRLKYLAEIGPKSRAAASKTVQRLNDLERRVAALESK